MKPQELSVLFATTPTVHLSVTELAVSLKKKKIEMEDEDIEDIMDEIKFDSSIIGSFVCVTARIAGFNEKITLTNFYNAVQEKFPLELCTPLDTLFLMDCCLETIKEESFFFIAMEPIAERRGNLSTIFSIGKNSEVGFILADPVSSIDKFDLDSPFLFKLKIGNK